MFRFVTVVLSLVLVMIPTAVANVKAQDMTCENREKVIGILTNKYKEGPVAVGISTNNMLIQVYAKKDGTTWTIIMTNSKGITCLLAAGTSWRGMKYNLDPRA